ncbi:hypothetical protein [Clostridium kluyveri]|uniref:Uncharacterized protein n=1 Tax=Clostridium kluyveri TaxID=1534 RepID=A0A1L5F9Z2_CLOKL|nr:hypothetical protein [Clostridium kluyveri]APM39836.1 hypothetical protein BS101_14375 [Clostridium kluyveri]
MLCIYDKKTTKGNFDIKILTSKGITEAQWTSLGLSDEKIRFAWYMEVSLSMDVLRLKEVRVNYNTV